MRISQNYRNTVVNCFAAAVCDHTSESCDVLFPFSKGEKHGAGVREQVWNGQTCKKITAFTSEMLVRLAAEI